MTAARPRARVLVVYAGGTIGMVPSAEGLQPMEGFAEHLQESLSRHVAGHLPAFDLISLPHTIDSAQLRPAHWHQIADPLIRHWDDYDGFVVLHGTDTLAWTASALSFMLGSIDKPVVLTGAQIPWMLPRSDALGNVENALTVASDGVLNEVVVCFGRHVLRGNRSRKQASTAFDAFGSPGMAPLASIGIGLQYACAPQGLLPDRGLDRATHFPLPSARSRPRQCPAFDNDAVALCMVHPGLSGASVEALLSQAGLRGLVLLSYGTGNLPSDDLLLRRALSEAGERGVVMVNVSQCWQSEVAQDTYASGAALNRMGVVGGLDMTPEAAFAKLHVLLATEDNPARMRARMMEPWCGELTPPGH